jgi:integrase
MRLTEASIKALTLPERGSRIYTDDTLPGFGVRVSRGGTRSYVLTHGRRRERETLGKVNVITLQEAKQEARRRLAEYTLGKDRPRSVSWDAAVAEYLEEKSLTLKPRVLHDYTYELKRNFRYGETKLTDLSPHDLQKSLNRLAHAPAHRFDAFAILRGFMRWAYRRHYLDRNPMERMQCVKGYKPRERILSDEELVRVWNAAGDGTFGRIVKMLILTGQRVGEITKLTGDMVGPDTITLPSWLAKNSRTHPFPLGDLARDILGPTRPAGVCYFPALGKSTPFNGHSPCKRRLDKRCGVMDWRLHDLRRTFASGLASIGVQLPVIERQLNHISGSFGGIVGVYQRYNFMPEMRQAIARWEARVLELVSNSAPPVWPGTDHSADLDQVDCPVVGG